MIQKTKPGKSTQQKINIITGQFLDKTCILAHQFARKYFLLFLKLKNFSSTESLQIIL
ncbi:MAG: hypothetical protein WDN75_14920 [Bacteroidota bacterium]